MKVEVKFWLAAVLGLVAQVLVPLTALLLLWPALTPAQQSLLALLPAEHPAIFFLSSLTWLALVLLGLHWIYEQSYRPLHRFTEDLRIIRQANPQHRATEKQGRTALQLAREINALAGHIQQQKSGIEQQLRHAGTRLLEERQLLAALVSDLPQGFIGCNGDGLILLYNRSVREMLSVNAGQHFSEGLRPGLGRSLFSLVDKNLVFHALEEIEYRLEKSKPNLRVVFMMIAASGRLLRVTLTPVFAEDRSRIGFVLMFGDITDQIALERDREVFFEERLERIRTSLTNIQAASEALLDYSDMDEAQRRTFRAVIRDESRGLAERLESSASRFYHYIRTRWPLETMLLTDLLALIHRKVDMLPGIYLETEAPEQALGVRVDTFAISRLLCFLMESVGAEEGNFRLRGCREDAFVRLDLFWKGPYMDEGDVAEFLEKSMISGGEKQPGNTTFRDVLQRHDAEIWVTTISEAQNCLRLLLPEEPLDLEEVELPASRPGISMRPEYYDFDLFHKPVEYGDLEKRPLASLTFTVFDTETTGLDPSGGDEIISIAAVRVVNGRLLKGDVFDCLVNTDRRIPTSSIRVHGIHPEMLRGQPGIAEVLQRFHDFAADSVLVAHNAAFDMKFLQMKEADTKIRFDHPVLDTLLLSAYLYPNQEAHDLESIAGRFGVPIIGRHTALGDSIVTGEILLRLLPAMHEQQIDTLEKAREASLKTWYARLNY